MGGGGGGGAQHETCYMAEIQNRSSRGSAVHPQKLQDFEISKSLKIDAKSM